MKIGDLIGGIIGAGPGEVVIQPNVSVCPSLALSCFDWTGKRNKIVSEDVNFPSKLFIYRALQRAGVGHGAFAGWHHRTDRANAGGHHPACPSDGAKIVARYLSLSSDGASECA